MRPSSDVLAAGASVADCFPCGDATRYCDEEGMVQPKQITCDGTEYTLPENASEHFLWRTNVTSCPNETSGYRCAGGIKYSNGACGEGTYLSDETLECERCEVGHFCVDGVMVPCPEGFFTYRNDASSGRCSSRSFPGSVAQRT